MIFFMTVISDFLTEKWTLLCDISMVCLLDHISKEHIALLSLALQYHLFWNRWRGKKHLYFTTKNNYVYTVYNLIK
jgi:hypothetical protein